MNTISGVIDGAEALWPHNQTVAGFDPDLDAAIMRALDNNRQPVFDASEDGGYIEAMPQVRLLFVKEDPAPVPFLDVLEAERLPRMEGPCDRCLTDTAPVARLWLPTGGSIVQVECCFACVGELPGLTWR